MDVVSFRYLVQKLLHRCSDEVKELVESKIKRVQDITGNTIISEESLGIIIMAAESEYERSSNDSV